MDIHTMPGHLIRRLHQISVALFMEAMTREGLTLTPVQYSALTAIRNHPGIDQATVAGLVAYDRATLGKVIDRLDERGLLERRPSEADRRSKVLTLTDAGAALLDQVKPKVEAIQPAILDGLDESERVVFIDMLQKVTLAGNDRSRAPMKPLGRD